MLKLLSHSRMTIPAPGDPSSMLPAINRMVKCHLCMLATRGYVNVTMHFADSLVKGVLQPYTSAVVMKTRTQVNTIVCKNKEKNCGGDACLKTNCLSCADHLSSPPFAPKSIILTTQNHNCVHYSLYLLPLLLYFHHD